MNIKLFRRLQTAFSILLFVGVFLICWHTTEFKLSEIQLSFWGIDSKLGWIWNSCLIVLAFSIFINVHFFVKLHGRLHEKYTEFIRYSFLLTSIFLFLTGFVDLTHYLHYVTAYLYFFSYPLVVFLFAHLNRKHIQYKEWRLHTIFSVCMVVLPMLVIEVFHGKAIAETIHSVIVIGWNVWILTID